MARKKLKPLREPGAYRVDVRPHVRKVKAFSRPFRPGRLPPRDEGGRWDEYTGDVPKALRFAAGDVLGGQRRIKISPHKREVRDGYSRAFRPAALTDRNAAGEFIRRGSSQVGLFGGAPVRQQRRKPKAKPRKRKKR